MKKWWLYGVVLAAIFLPGLVMAMGAKIEVYVVDKDTQEGIDGASVISIRAEDPSRVKLGSTGEDGKIELPVRDILAGEKLLVSKRGYKQARVSIDKIEGQKEVKVPLKEKTPPAEVKGLKIENRNGEAIVSWQASSSPDTDYYQIFFREGIGSYRQLTKEKVRDTAISAGKVRMGMDYYARVVAIDKNGNKNKGTQAYLFLAPPVKNIDKTADIKGKLKGLSGQGKGIVMMYPINIGPFANYDPALVAPTKVVCDAEGNFASSPVAPGLYTVKAFEDLNGNEAWDGNWLDAKPEATVMAKRIWLYTGKTKQLDLELQPVVTGVPEVVYEEFPGFVDLYHAAWDFAREKRSKGQVKNGFVHAYMDEGFNDHIYQWDTCFMMFFGIYGGNDFPAMNSVDNFYLKQRPNGYICRVQNENTGGDYDPSASDPSVNPPLYAWIEYTYFRLTGDDSRLLWAVWHNHRYFQWLKNNCRVEGGYYYTSNLGSGMDNSPREGMAYGWIDMTAQMALFAKYMSELSRLAGMGDVSDDYRKEYESLKKLVNDKMWDEAMGIYFDIKKDGSLHKKKTIGSFWPMLAGIPSPEQVNALVKHLTDPKEFATPHMFPTLSKDEPEYDAKGYYWRGAVWAPTEFMVIKGLEYSGKDELAREASLNHLRNMWEVYANFVPDKKKLPYKEKNIPFPKELDGTKQIWECYSPEKAEPATRWDNFYYVRPKFVGWSGVGPIVLFIENVMGIRPDAFDNKIIWRVESEKPHGVKNLPFNGGQVDLMMEGIKNGQPIIKVRSTTALDLEIVYKGKVIKQKIKAESK